MRVSDNMINTLLTGYLVQNKSKLYELQYKAASGKKVNLPSDDPGAYELIRRIKDSDACMTQKLKNCESVKLDLTLVEGVLDGVTEILHRASEIAVSASDGTKTAADRIALGKEVDMMLNQLLDLGNTQYGGRYIFSGLRTDTPAYAVATTDGMITSVTYQGNTNVREVEIGPYIAGSSANRVEANIPGSDPTSGKAIFQTDHYDLFGSLIRLRDQLLAGNNPVNAETFTADPLTDTLTVNGNYATGAQITLETTDALPDTTSGRLVQGVTYYVVNTGVPGQIQLARSYEDAIAVPPVVIDITDAGTGTHSISCDHLGELNEALNRVLSMQAEVGARLQRVELNVSLLMDQKTAQAGTLEATQDVDIAELTLEMTQKRTAYEAALRVIAATMNTSLVDYL